MGRLPPAMNTRLRSLDVFRGLAVALMILVNNPGSWSHLYAPLDHAAWHGCTPTDLVFPFFLFAVGNALALVLPALRAAGPRVFWPRVGRRTLLIFGLGLFLNACPFVRWDAAGELVPRSWETLRIMGVLQRIALAYGAAAAIVWLGGRRGALAAAALLLAGYWAACLAFGAPGDPYSLQGWFGTAVDRALLGEAHLYRGEGLPFDPEGLASTAPAIAQVLLGWWVGEMLLQPGTGAEPGPERVARLLLWATVLLAAAWVWQGVLPLNKKIWTPSYVLHTTALAMMVLALLVHVIDVRGRPAELAGWAGFFEVFGRNPLFIFVLSGFVPRVLALLRWRDGSAGDGAPAWTSPLPWLYKNVFADLAPDLRVGSLAYAVATLAAYWLIAAALHRQRLYIRV
jgi:predicted acyltransferase